MESDRLILRAEFAEQLGQVEALELLAKLEDRLLPLIHQQFFQFWTAVGDLEGVVLSS